MTNPSDAIAHAIDLPLDLYENLGTFADEDLELAIAEGTTLLTETRFGTITIASHGPDEFSFTPTGGATYLAPTRAKARNFLIGSYSVEA